MPDTYADGMTRRTVGWLLVGLQAVLLLALVLLPHRAPTTVSLAVGGALLVAGFVLGAASFVSLGSALTATPVPIAGAGLRTSGPYRVVRHPIYSAILLGAAGFTVAVGTWWTVGAAVVLAVFFVGKSRWEDHLLRELYGPPWEAWARTTGALLPRIHLRER